MKLDDIVFAFIEGGDTGAIAHHLDDISKSNSSDYSRALNYMLSLSERIEQQGIGESYALIGGYAVLAHLYSVLGEDMLSRWRGSSDVDVVTKDHSIKGMIDSAFEESNTEQTHFPYKKTVHVKDAAEILRELEGEINPALTPFKIDLYHPEGGQYLKIHTEDVNQDVWDRVDTINILGHPIRVVSAPDMVRLKLAIETENGLPRDRDISDIYNLTGVIEQKDGSPERMNKILGYTRGLKMKDILGLYAELGKPSEEVLIRPSEEFMQNYRTLVG